MPEMEPCFASGIVRMRLSGDCSAHLASETIPVQNEGTELFRNIPLESGFGLRILQKIFSGFQVVSVIVCENLVAFLISQFPNPARPFALSSNFPQFV